ncbi:hypothetical protein GCM10023176_62600 [Micromonospora coerulea]|uniref:Uncharacterized protein n=1 Tax=Micromonospora coerulea TaxID=47856 RepID=A0ABP8T7I2_9ACTN
MLPVITLVKAPPSARNPIASVAPLFTASTTANPFRHRRCWWLLRDAAVGAHLNRRVYALLIVGIGSR